MLYTTPTVRDQTRSGVILLVILAMLTIMAILGVSFYYFANHSSQTARFYKESSPQLRNSPLGVKVDSRTLSSWFFGQLLYDLEDDKEGIKSALRGHSLARLVFGYNSQALNGAPFNGTGRLHAPSPYPNIDDFLLINYTYHSKDNFIRDPERPGWRTNLQTPRRPYTGGVNVPWTYPDLNNMFLAAVKADGTVLAQSFHRPWLFNPNHALNDSSNPNWTNEAGKYLILRPRPVDMGPGFPYPEDATGDVKNLTTTSSGNDSIWMDLGFPVLTAPNGLKYKPLFAPLILDLDGKVNVNVHGNIRGAGSHVSNQGWGPWEVNLGAVIPEYRNLFVGNQRHRGKYGPDQSPGKKGAQMYWPFSGRPHGYAQVDYDALVSGRYQSPGNPFVDGPFARFPMGYDNLSGNAPATERFEHPALYNPYLATADDLLFSVSDLAKLIRRGPELSRQSTLAQLCPQSFANQRLRRLVTTYSFDFDAPGAAPWLYDPTNSQYQVPNNAADQAPQGPPVPFPSLALRGSPIPPKSEFAAPGLPPSSPGADWKGLQTALQRVNLNRPLTPYPMGTDADRSKVRFDNPNRVSAFEIAQEDRQFLAAEIYDRLLSVTGVSRSAKIPTQPSEQELQVRRWLAQLAVNIVDYRDSDDICTPFNFYSLSDAGNQPIQGGDLTPTGDPAQPDAELPRFWVFGTELPRVVLSEVLAEREELPPVMNQDPVSRVKVWIELHNPFQAPPPGMLAPEDGYPVVMNVQAEPDSILQKPNTYSPYRVVLAKGLYTRPLNDNVLGKADTVRTETDDADFANVVSLAGGGQQQAPSPSIAPRGYFLIGPAGQDANNTLKVAPDGTIPDETPRIETNNLEYEHTFKPGMPEEEANGLTVLLRRLANPYAPHDDRPTITDEFGETVTNPWYNPYLTVDTLEKITLHTTGAMNEYASTGKKQPFVSHISQVEDQISSDQNQKTQHTFGQANVSKNPAANADWLVHLDRELISAMEILHVSGYQPYQLTQRFVNQGHRVPWFDASRRLYRVFEFLEARHAGAGASIGPNLRVPGKININTIWDPETFLALCDPQAGNSAGFTSSEVLKIYQQMLDSRSPALRPSNQLSAADRPFRSMSTGYSLKSTPMSPDPQHEDRGISINDTFLRSRSPNADALAGAGTSMPRLFEIPGQHPYQQAELLTKIYPRITTRSNVFAVWVTVGFFRVTDDTTQPVKLGEEIGRAEGLNKRPRFFAIVDRSVIQRSFQPVQNYEVKSDPAVLYVISD